MIGKVVQSLLQQTAQIHQLLIHINNSAVPPTLPYDSRIKVHYSSASHDLTDIGKFKMAATVESGVVATVDDDIIYPKNYIQRLTGAILSYEGRAVVGYHGAILPRESIQSWSEYLRKRSVYWFRDGLKEDQAVHVLGTGTMAYHTDLINFDWKSFDYGRMADLHVAVEAQKKGIPMIALSRPDDWIKSIAQTKKVYRQSIWRTAQKDSTLQKQMIEVVNRVNQWEEPDQI